MSSLKFGTSGLRGLVGDLTDGSSIAYCRAFLRHLAATGSSGTDKTLLIGRDLRSSSPAISRDCAEAARLEGWTPLDCGALPTPALALLSLTRKLAAVMVTGSHIPDDRNGLKFYTPTGEISKADEAGILAAFAALPPAEDTASPPPTQTSDAALTAYRDRYIDAFGPDFLTGVTVGVYQQSTVIRDLIVDVLEGLGAIVVPFARADAFIPVDTEAYRPEDRALLLEWAGEHEVDAIVSADGDADRPLVADGDGRIVRGDVLGLLTVNFLKLSTIATPLTSSSALERVCAPAKVLRTRVGSPFVIAAMEEAAASGAAGIVGFEANGGLLLGSDVEIAGRRLAALATRDALLPILSTLGTLKASGQPLSAIVAGLGAGFAAGNRLERVPAEASGPFLQKLAGDAAFRGDFLKPVGGDADVNALDGVRVMLNDGRIVHFRASGNAPELRCYVEAAGEADAEALLEWGLKAAAKATGVSA